MPGTPVAVTSTVPIPSQTFSLSGQRCTCQHKPCEHFPPRTDAFTSNLFSLESIRAATVHMTGKIKTLIDASVTEPQQNKALKDLTHAALWDDYATMREWAYHEAERIDGRQPAGEFWPLRFGSKEPTLPTI